MRVYSLVALLFILVSFSLGAAIIETELTPFNLTNSLDEANITQIELSRVEVTGESFVNINNFLTVIESYIRFILTLFIEFMKVGINFGYDNPDYFEPGFILTVVKWIVILVVISLLIKPFTYLVVLLILLGIWIKDKTKSNSIRENKK